MRWTFGVAVSAITALTHAQTLPTSTVALSGMPIGDGVPLATALRPVIGPAGQVGFVGGSTGSVRSSLLYWDGTSTSVILRSTDTVPGSSRNYGDLHSVHFDEQGAIAVSSANEVVYGAPVQWTRIASTAIPGPSDTFFQVANNHGVALTPGGTLAVESIDHLQRRTVWTGHPGQLTQVVQSSTPVAGTGATIRAGIPRYDDAGAVYFDGPLSGGGYTNGEYTVVRAGPGAGPATPIVLPATPAPGGGTITDSRRPPSVNRYGKIGIMAAVRGVDGVLRNTSFAGHLGSIAPIAAVGQPAPGLPPGQTFVQLESPIVSGSGNVAVVGYTGFGPTRAGLWLSSPSGLSPMIVPGQAVGGPVPGTSFLTIETDPAAVIVNGRDQASVIGTISIPGLGARTALLGYDPTLGLLPIAVEGMSFDVGPGDARTIQEIGVAHTSTYGAIVGTNSQDGLDRWLNDLGQTVYTLYFTDGTLGVFRTEIPAPGGALVLFGGAALCGTRRRRRDARDARNAGTP